MFQSFHQQSAIAFKQASAGQELTSFAVLVFVALVIAFISLTGFLLVVIAVAVTMSVTVTVLVRGGKRVLLGLVRRSSRASRSASTRVRAT